MSEKQMTLEEVAHGILNQTHTIERCGLWAAAIRAHKCEPPERDPLAELEQRLWQIKAGSVLEIYKHEMNDLLALVREARKERDGEA